MFHLVIETTMSTLSYISGIDFIRPMVSSRLSCAFQDCTCQLCFVDFAQESECLHSHYLISFTTSRMSG